MLIEVGRREVVLGAAVAMCCVPSNRAVTFIGAACAKTSVTLLCMAKHLVSSGDKTLLISADVVNLAPHI